jgi:hypothetical protein
MRLSRFLLRQAASIYFYVTDLDAAIRFDLRQGKVEADQRMKNECDLALHSQALLFASTNFALSAVL